MAVNRAASGEKISSAMYNEVDDYLDDLTDGTIQAGDAALLDGAALSTDGTLGGETPSDLKVPTEKAISTAISERGAGVPIGTPIFWLYDLTSLPNGLLPMDGRTLIRADYPTLWGLAESFVGTDRRQFGAGNGSTTFTLPDWRGEFLRGAYYGDISAASWDVTTNDDVDLGRSDIPMGTPVIFSVAPCTGITAGTIYYLALRTGTKYCLYDTESHANANGATGKVALSGTPVDSSYTTAGLPQGSAMWGHYHNSTHSGSAVPKYTGGGVDYNIGGGEEFITFGVTAPITDGTHPTPSTSDESRSRNTQGIWCIQAALGTSTEEDGSNLEQRVSDLENAYINNKYETGWINRSDWTNVHLGSSTTKDADSNVTHNLGKHLRELDVRLIISPTGADSDSFEIKIGTDGTDSGSYGLNAKEVDDDNIKIQTGAAGILYILEDGSNGALGDWYYKIIVVAHNAYTFVDARSDGNRCRAWVNFNGTGTVAIRASENVDGITDNGTGDYTINLTSGAVEDEDYAVSITTGGTSSAYNSRTLEDTTARSSAAVRIFCADASFNANDPAQVNVSIFR